MPASTTDHLANERTYLAWVRTGIAIMAFGFVVDRFGLYLREIAARASNSIPPAAAKPFSEWTGVLLLLAGSTVVALAFVRYRRIRADLEQGSYRVHDGLAWALSAIVTLVGLTLALYMFATG